MLRIHLNLLNHLNFCLSGTEVLLLPKPCLNVVTCHLRKEHTLRKKTCSSKLRNKKKRMSPDLSIWQVAVIPIGIWVILTALSVVLACWPPVPQDRNQTFGDWIPSYNNEKILLPALVKQLWQQMKYAGDLHYQMVSIEPNNVLHLLLWHIQMHIHRQSDCCPLKYNAQTKVRCRYYHKTWGVNSKQ